jgi:O-antigen ligase
MVFSGARAPIAALILAAPLLVLRLHVPQRPLSAWFSITAVLVASSSLALLANSWLAAVIAVFRRSVFGVTAGGGGSLYLADRDVIFLDAVRQFVAAPIGGIGLGSYRGPFGEEYPHNIILNYAVDGGVLPLLLMGAIAAIGVSRLFLTRVPEAYGSLCMSAYFFGGSFFAGSYYDARGMWLFLLLGLIPIWRIRVRRCFQRSGFASTLRDNRASSVAGR